jgi:hypothetical protein
MNNPIPYMCRAMPFVAAFLLSWVNDVVAQYTLTWSNIEGGGCLGTGGVYAVSGTIGQPDAGRMAGGLYALSGGFWSIVDMVQTPGLPLLNIERLPGGAVRIFWHRQTNDVVLEEVSAISSSPVTGWALVPPATYQTNLTHVSITLPMPTGMRVYRLRRP